jgi:hypothetical protein
MEPDRPATKLIESLERFDEMSEERVASHLAIGDDVEPRVLLERHGIANRAIFDELELRRCEFSLLVLLSGFH